MTRRRITIVALLALLLPLVAMGVKGAFFLLQPVAPQAPVVLTIPAGAPLAQVARLLEHHGVVSDAPALKLLARVRGDATRIKAGEYAFSEASSPGGILDRLIKGDVQQHRFTIPEGFNLEEIAAKLVAEGRGDGARFLRLAKDADLCRKLDIAAATLEGYLFPETYTVEAGMSEERLIRSMVEQFNSRLSPRLIEGGRTLKLGVHQLVTLASIIQKEAGNLEEMPVISSVFHNRLNKGIPLQADPTVIYGIENFDGNLTRKHLRTTTPYNTYRISGLPAGPIANPGQKALEAAAFPAATDYYYFVARGDGTHAFSKTLKEHNALVRRYQLRR